MDQKEITINVEGFKQATLPFKHVYNGVRSFSGFVPKKGSKFSYHMTVKLYPNQTVEVHVIEGLKSKQQKVFKIVNLKQLL